MVRPRPEDNDFNAFAIDEDDDMDALLEEAANAGSAAVSEIEDDSFNDFGMNDTKPQPSKVEDEIDFDMPEAVEKSAPAPIEEPANETPVGVGDEIDALLQTIELRQDPEPKAEPVVVAPEPEATPAVVQPVQTAPVAQEPVVQPVKHGLTPTPKAFTIPDQIALAQRVTATVDVYRSLTSEARDIVAQLLAPTPDEFTQDEGTVAIRAIYAEPIQESTQKALIEAKEASPVDRVFYVLGLPKDVLRYLGELVQAYTSNTIPAGISELQFAKALVEGIEALGNEPIVYAEAMAKVLGAAQSK